MGGLLHCWGQNLELLHTKCEGHRALLCFLKVSAGAQRRSQWEVYSLTSNAIGNNREGLEEDKINMRTNSLDFSSSFSISVSPDLPCLLCESPYVIALSLLVLLQFHAVCPMLGPTSTSTSTYLPVPDHLHIYHFGLHNSGQ